MLWPSECALLPSLLLMNLNESNTACCMVHVQVASQVGALDAGYTAGLTADTLRAAKCLYLLGAVSIHHAHTHTHTTHIRTKVKLI